MHIAPEVIDDQPHSILLQNKDPSMNQINPVSDHFVCNVVHVSVCSALIIKLHTVTTTVLANHNLQAAFNSDDDYEPYSIGPQSVASSFDERRGQSPQPTPLPADSMLSGLEVPDPGLPSLAEPEISDLPMPASPGNYKLQNLGSGYFKITYN